MARLGLRNEGGALLSVKSNQLIEIELGYLWDDGTDELSSRRVAFVGYVQTPGKVARVGPGETCDLVAYCPFIRLRDERAHSNEPDFQVSSSKDAVHWLAARAGFSDDQMLLEGSDDRMFLGLEGLDQTQENGVSDPMNSSLMPAFGTELLDSVDEYTRRDGESLIWVRPYDVAGEGFLLCKSNGAYGPTDGVLFSLNESAGPCNPAAPTYHLYELSVEQVPMDPEQYSDLVVVRGKTPAGEYVQATCADLARVADPSHPAWSGGWRHMHCEARDHLQSPALLQQRANELFSERSRLPAVATVETDLLWYDVGWRTVHKGDRFVLTNAVNAGKAYNQGVLSYGATVKQFRVVGFRHFWDGPGTMPRTVLIGRAMWA